MILMHWFKVSVYTAQPAPELFASLYTRPHTCKPHMQFASSCGVAAAMLAALPATKAGIQSALGFTRSVASAQTVLDRSCVVKQHAVAALAELLGSLPLLLLLPLLCLRGLSLLSSGW